MRFSLPIALLLASALACGQALSGPPTREEVEAKMGLPSQGDRIRGVRDAVGFVVDAAQAEEVIGHAIEIERDSFSGGEQPFIGGVCPHDDHLYAAPVYVHLTERITAPRVILIGVFHRARYWDLEDKMVFDSFESWHGPWKPVPVDPLREELLEHLRPEHFVVDNTMHAMEHSLEAIVPFLQYRNRDITIVPILVPYMKWEQLESLSINLSLTLSFLMHKKGWELGRDVAIVISSDAVHYGEDFEHAPFGSDAEAYRLAVERDHALVDEHLAGPLEATKLEGLLYELVDKEDVRRYRLPWCGRFSVPFGLELLRMTAAGLGKGAPVGHFLRYGTSISEPEPPLSEGLRESGLGYTAPSNFHHWVGYAAVGYRF